MAPATETVALCSKCQAPLDREGSPNWCKACRAKYQREYEGTKKQMNESKGFANGVSAMREYLAQRFAEYGTSGSFTGAEIAATIRTCKGPAANSPL